MAAKVVVDLVRSCWGISVDSLIIQSSPLLVSVSVPILGVPLLLSEVLTGSRKIHPREMLAVCSSHKMYFLYIAFHLLEIYDPAEQSQDTLRPNEEEVTGFEQKISMVRKFVWGCTANVQVNLSEGFFILVP
ncbi:uncharacterized protein LOC114974964 isoform X3 [Acropora millepora]|uniref:uncharacterized protein LOC114974964 isoform X3 n=1 Tax=Acropora millepora TaxID=45264 RepID=UPI001CF40412|nr:uncharacterized protein LOC114974964 isoform X3 [Acropora millepora]